MTDLNKTPKNRLYKRIDENKIKLWFLMSGKRWLVTGILVLIVFSMLLISGYIYTAADSSIRDSDSVDTLFQALLGSIITGVTIVVSLNQLVLSQELGAVYDQRERMEGALKFREDASEHINASVSPVEPSQFMRSMVQVCATRSKNIKKLIADVEDQDCKDVINTYTDSVIDNANQVIEELDGVNFGEFEVISSALDFNYSWKIYFAKRIKREYSDLLSENAMKEINKLIDILSLFGPTREHFKTIYFQSELIDLSRRLLFSSVPALIVSVYMIIFFNFKTYNVTVFNIETLVLVVVIATTISLIPFLVLISHVLRVATITKHTLSIGPFILREVDEMNNEVDWGVEEKRE